MNKKRDLKDEITGQILKEEGVEIFIIYAGIGRFVDIEMINVTEIITPHPYSLFALCKHYECFQQN
jgi:hypothetical protein